MAEESSSWPLPPRVRVSGYVIAAGGKGGPVSGASAAGGGGGGGLIQLLAPSVVSDPSNLSVSGGDVGTVGAAGAITATARSAGGGGGGSVGAGGNGSSIFFGDPSAPSVNSQPGQVVVRLMNPAALF